VALAGRGGMRIAFSLSGESTANAGGYGPTDRYSSPMKRTAPKLQDTRIDAVATEARMSKSGLLHYFLSKGRLVEVLVIRTAEGRRTCYTEAYERTPKGSERMARALRAPR